MTWHLKKVHEKVLGVKLKSERSSEIIRDDPVSRTNFCENYLKGLKNTTRICGTTLLKVYIGRNEVLSQLATYLHPVAICVYNAG